MWEDTKYSDVTFENKLFQAVQIDSYKNWKKSKIKPYQLKCLLNEANQAEDFIIIIMQSISYIECQYKLVVKGYVGNKKKSSWNSKRKVSRAYLSMSRLCQFPVILKWGLHKIHKQN